MARLHTGNPDNEGETFIPGDRINEGHVAIRFDDHKQRGWKICLDGRDVTNDCNEAVAGVNGAVVLIGKDNQWALVTGSVSVLRACEPEK